MKSVESCLTTGSFSLYDSNLNETGKVLKSREDEKEIFATEEKENKLQKMLSISSQNLDGSGEKERGGKFDLLEIERFA
jgi:hypothetical protein